KVSGNTGSAVLPTVARNSRPENVCSVRCAGVTRHARAGLSHLADRSRGGEGDSRFAPHWPGNARTTHRAKSGSNQDALCSGLSGVGWGAVCPSPQAGVDLLECRGARAQLLLRERVERRVDRVEMVMQVHLLFVDVEQAGDDLTLRRVGLQEV